MKDKEIIKEFRERFPADEWTEQNLYTRSDEMLEFGLDEIESFLLQKLRQAREEGFKAGQEELKQIIIEDVPHKYQKRLLKLANKI